MAALAHRWLFVLNPNSGYVRSRPEVPGQVRAFIRAHHLKADLALTERPGHATTLAAAGLRDGYERIVAVGGDGTMNEVARALVGTTGCLGLVPLGSGNGLARELGYPLVLDAALRALLRATVMQIDVGRWGERTFFCAAGTGLDADIVQRFNRRKRRGFPAYVLETARGIWRQNCFTYTFTATTGEERKGRASLVVAANAAQFGNGARIAPGARLDDGALDLVVVPPLTVTNALALAYRLFRGSLAQSSLVNRLRFQQGTLERTPAGAFHTDGEVWCDPGSWSIGVARGALNILHIR